MHVFPTTTTTQLFTKIYFDDRCTQSDIVLVGQLPSHTLELKTISNTAITLKLPIVFVNIFVIVSNACLTVFVSLILTGM